MENEFKNEFIQAKLLEADIYFRENTYKDAIDSYEEILKFTKEDENYLEVYSKAYFKFIRASKYLMYETAGITSPNIEEIDEIIENLDILIEFNKKLWNRKLQKYSSLL